MSKKASLLEERAFLDEGTEAGLEAGQLERGVRGLTSALAVICIVVEAASPFNKPRASPRFVEALFAMSLVTVQVDRPSLPRRTKPDSGLRLGTNSVSVLKKTRKTNVLGSGLAAVNRPRFRG